MVERLNARVVAHHDFGVVNKIIPEAGYVEDEGKQRDGERAADAMVLRARGLGPYLRSSLLLGGRFGSLLASVHAGMLRAGLLYGKPDRVTSTRVLGAKAANRG